MLGSYSYKFVSSNKYQITYNNNQYFLQIAHVNPAIAAIQFFSDNTFTDAIPIPAGFTLADSENFNNAPWNNTFFITWVESYTLSLNQAPIWKLVNQKRQAVQTANNAHIITL